MSKSAADLTGKRILLALSGGIACYKAAALASRLAQSSAAVTALMTEAATRFIGPLTLESLTGRPVYTSQWQAQEDHAAQHVALAREADLAILAPASANTLAKLAHGFCDNVVTTVFAALPRDTPVLIAPAMNAEMWANPIVQANVEKLVEVLGYHAVGPESGWQACRTSGAGRMSEPEAIYEKSLSLLGA